MTEKNLPYVDKSTKVMVQSARHTNKNIEMITIGNEPDLVLGSIYGSFVADRDFQ